MARGFLCNTDLRSIPRIWREFKIREEAKQWWTQWHSERTWQDFRFPNLLFFPHVHGEVTDFSRILASQVTSCRIWPTVVVQSRLWNPGKEGVREGGEEEGRKAGHPPRAGGNSETWSFRQVAPCQ